MSLAHSAYPDRFGTSRIFRLLFSLRQRFAALPSSPRLSVRLSVFAAVTLLLLCQSSARADTYWNVTSGDWSTAGNWTIGLPTSRANADIFNGGAATITQAGEVCSTLSLGNTAGSGTIQMIGGSLSASNADIGCSGTGTFTQSGGTNQISTNFYLGDNSDSDGVYNLSGGYSSASNTYTGGTIVSGGTLNVTGSLANNGANSVFIADSGTAFGPMLTQTVASGSNTYAGIGSTITDDLGTSAQLLYGGSTGMHSLSMQWRQRNAADLSIAVTSDVLNLSGMTNSGSQTDLFVLQMSYDPYLLAGGTAAAAGLAAAGDIYLVSQNGNGQWVNATSLNIGGTSQFMGMGAWTSADTTLGEYGVNTANDTVWAVLDHNSQYAVVPEPSTLLLLGAGAIGLLGYRWRRRKHAPA